MKVYYQTIFAMAQHHKYSIAELEDLLPFERDIYLEMIIDFVRRQEEARAANQG